jgi:sulfide:quinone oxidoreductase
MDRFRVVIAGGGVAAIEGLLRLRRLAGDAVDVSLLAPNEEFAFRALSVKEPFAGGRAQRHELRAIAADQGADLVTDRVGSVDVAEQVVHTDASGDLPFDALLLAVGGRMAPAFDHVKTFRDAEADALFGGVIQDIEGGYSKTIAFLAPDGPMWLLPLYELALMTAVHASSAGFDDVELSLVTPEPWPLAGFGRAASEAVAELLESAGIALYCSALAQVPGKQHLLVQPQGVELRPDRMIAMPRVSGPSIRGIPGGGDRGFIPIDRHCSVPATDGRVFAAGDATAFPIKHGSLGAQQADTAAAGIARLAGADVEPDAYDAQLRGMLLTGRNPLYLTARVVGGQGFESEVSEEPLWTPPDKVSTEELGPYLAGRG